MSCAVAGAVAVVDVVVIVLITKNTTTLTTDCDCFRVLVCRGYTSGTDIVGVVAGGVVNLTMLAVNEHKTKGANSGTLCSALDGLVYTLFNYERTCSFYLKYFCFRLLVYVS